VAALAGGGWGRRRGSAVVLAIVACLAVSKSGAAGYLK
jgi:hypothetical protein